MNVAPYLLDESDLLNQCRLETFRSSGPGGQHANRTESAVRLTHKPTGVVASCQQHRQQDRNRKEAMGLLRLRLAITQPGTVDVGVIASFREGNRLRIGPNSPNYFRVVSVLLAALENASGVLAEAAEATALSSSQMVKALMAHKEVAQAANACRQKYGIGPLKHRR